MSPMHEFMQWAVLVALACGATFAVCILDACSTIAAATSRKLFGKPPGPLAGLGLFLFLLIGLPALTVLWGFASGRLPAY